MYGTPSANGSGPAPADQYSANNSYTSPLVCAPAILNNAAGTYSDTFEQHQHGGLQQQQQEGVGAVTRTLTRSSSSYEKLERHEEVHEVHHEIPQQQPTAATNDTNIPAAETPSRFQFVSDTSAPNELSKMQYEALKRKAEFKAHILEIDRRVAAWTTKLAHETIDRELDHEEVAQKAIYAPMEAAFGRVMDRLETKLGDSVLLGRQEDEEDATSNEKSPGQEEVEVEEEKKSGGKGEEGKKTSPPSLPEMERKACELDKAMLKYVHKTAYNARVKHLDTPIATIIDEVKPALRLEQVKADRREGAIVRNYMSLAADATRWYAEENAARVAEVEMLRMEKEDKAVEETRDSGKILADIRAMRQLLEDERQERQKADEKIMAKIIETRKTWQRIVLESIGDAE